MSEELRQRALEGAQACARLLKERFGARRVLLFGSLRDKGRWHERSDVDLAVEGLAPEDYFAAYAECRKVLPPELELDLVSLETARPQLKAHILKEMPMPDDPLAALQSRVEDELTALEELVAEMSDLLDRCSHSPDRVELRAMASMLHEFYNGVESILERVMIGIGEELPRGATWHADLLSQAAQARPDLRPAVIDDALHDRLRQYLHFRHFFRHAYGYTLDWPRMRHLVEGMPATFDDLRRQLAIFLQNLLQHKQRGSHGNA